MVFTAANPVPVQQISRPGPCTQILDLHLLIIMFKSLNYSLQHELVFTIYALSNTSLQTYAVKRMFICT